VITALRQEKIVSPSCRTGLSSDISSDKMGEIRHLP
jgi:hypothetical protein